MGEDTNGKDEVRDLTGGMFGDEFAVSAEEAGEFLVGIGEQLRENDDLTLEGDGWEIPFEFGDEVEIELDYDGNVPELEIEVEMEGGREKDEAPTVS
jgi:amphi-Trp domain-containing protein